LIACLLAFKDRFAHLARFPRPRFARKENKRKRKERPNNNLCLSFFFKTFCLLFSRLPFALSFLEVMLLVFLCFTFLFFLFLSNKPQTASLPEKRIPYLCFDDFLFFFKSFFLPFFMWKDPTFFQRKDPMLFLSKEPRSFLWKMPMLFLSKEPRSFLWKMPISFFNPSSFFLIFAFSLKTCVIISCPLLYFFFVFS